MVKHKVNKNTLDKGYASEWVDNHMQDYNEKIDLECDFLTNDIINNWDPGQTSGGLGPTNELIDGHAMAHLHTGAGAGKITSIRYMMAGNIGNITCVNDGPIMTMALWLKDLELAGVVAEFGLINSDTATAFLPNQSGSYFRIESNTLYAVCGNGGAETKVNVTPLLGISEYGTYKIIQTGATCYFYVDNMVTPATAIPTTPPPSDLTMKIGIQTPAGADSEIYVDAVGLQRARYIG